jgi:hypothetical protein
MTRNFRYRFALMVLLLLTSLIMTSCNFPGMQPAPDTSATSEALATSAALTVAARLTEASGDTPLPPSPVPTTSPTLQPATATPTETGPSLTPTLTSTITKTEVPCDRASFVKDVTIPDGTELIPGEDFTKVWQLKNTGSCTWNSAYSLVFDHGDSMGGSASKSLTAGTVAPGQVVDISVDLTAPNTPDTYKGYWKIRNPTGVVFGVGPSGDVAFWVEIVVAPETTTVELVQIDGESGSVRSNGSVLSVKNVGDTSGDLETQTFLSFDLSGIPANATITEVIVDFDSYDQLGDPFGDLGCLDVYKHTYGSLDASDFFSGSPSGRLIRWCSAGTLSSLTIDDDMVTALQSRIGTNRFQLRLQFQTDVTIDAEADMVRFGTPLKLTVTYYTP